MAVLFISVPWWLAMRSECALKPRRKEVTMHPDWRDVLEQDEVGRGRSGLAHWTEDRKRISVGPRPGPSTRPEPQRRAGSGGAGQHGIDTTGEPVGDQPDPLADRHRRVLQRVDFVIPEE